MKKYLSVIDKTIKEYFVYRLNFVLWRFRSVVTLLVIYFLWLAAIPEGKVIFGFDQAKILTYVLGTSLIRSFVLSSRNTDVAGEIASGELSNYLLKPINYIKYWFSRDLVDKLLNTFFSIFEIFLIVKILNPPIIFQNNLSLWVFTFFAISMGMLLNFFISFILSCIAFWTPENPWPVRFLFNIFMEFFTGALFPLNILPSQIFNLINLLPFPYLLYFPLNIYLGNLDTRGILTGFSIMIFWTIIGYLGLRTLFKFGLKNYAAWGR